MLEEIDFNILIPGDVVAPKCPRSELLLEFTTLRPVRPGVVRVEYEIVIGHTGYVTRDRFFGESSPCCARVLGFRVGGPWKLLIRSS